MFDPLKENGKSPEKKEDKEKLEDDHNSTAENVKEDKPEEVPKEEKTEEDGKKSRSVSPAK